MIGPAYAGKTTLLYHFKLGEHVQAVVGMEKQGWWGPQVGHKSETRYARPCGAHGDQEVVEIFSAFDHVMINAIYVYYICILYIYISMCSIYNNI